MKRALQCATVLALFCASCSSTSPSSSPHDGGTSASASPTYPADCKGLAEAPSYDCAEQLFWAAFQREDVVRRKDSEAALLNAISAASTPADARGKSLMHFRLGQLRLAMSLENKQTDYVLRAGTTIIAEFDKAMVLDSQDGIVAPWKDTMEMAIFAILSDWEKAVPLAERGFQNVALNPMGNTLSLSGTTIGFPLSTGVPQRTVTLIDAWQCSGVEWCTKNTSHAPYARPGLTFHFAEAYARTGNKAKATELLDASLAAPGAAQWPYRYVVEEARRDVDAYVKRFTDLGPEGSAFDIAYANQSYGCLFCHASQ